MEPNINGPDHWLGEHKPLLDELNFAYRVFVPRSHEFFTLQERPLNKTLLSNLIRYHVWYYLQSNGFDATEEAEESERDTETWELHPSANNAIKIVYRGSSIRVHKADRILSKTADFYQPALFEKDGEVSVTKLIVQYILDDDSRYQGLLLTKPVLERVGTTEEFKVTSYQWLKRASFPELDPSRIVRAEYAHPSELPLESKKAVAGRRK
jgi:hypothetical protein